MKTLKKILAAVLAVVMLMSIAVTAFAADYSFAYYIANEYEDVYVTAFRGEVPADGYVEIPDEIDGHRVIGVAEHTFDNLQELKGISVSEYVIDIHEDAFYGCNNIIDVHVRVEEDEDIFNSEEWFEEHKQDYVIENDTLVKYKGTDKIVTIPYNCVKISKEAFKDNTDITTVYFEKNLKVIEESAFEGCKYLANVIIAPGITDIEVGKNAFEGTKWLANYPSEFVSIGTNLIKYKGEPDKVTIPNVFKSISSGAFYTGEEKAEDIAFKVRVPKSLEKFGEDAFLLYNSITPVYPELVVISNSAADKYLHEKGIAHVYAALPGDAINDNKITAGDARYVLRLSAKLEIPEDAEEMLYVADMTGDNRVAADDARLILRIAAKLEKYTIGDIYSLPRTDYEVLLTAANALSTARAYGCAYAKNEYQYLSDIKMNTNTKTYFNMYKTELTPEKKAVTVTYNQNTPEAYENLFDITLIDASKIKSHSCEIKEGKYYIEIVLEDETVNGNDVVASTFTEKMFPVESVAHFTSKAVDKYWYNDSIKYNMTYNDCTLKMVINTGNLTIDSIDLQMNYDFEVEGKIMGIAIKDGKNPATATRTDVVRYSNFVYFSK